MDDPDAVDGMGFEKLKTECVFYVSHLKELGGRGVPKHYGLYLAHTTWGDIIVIAVLSYEPGIPWNGGRHDWKSDNQLYER